MAYLPIQKYSKLTLLPLISLPAPLSYIGLALDCQLTQLLVQHLFWRDSFVSHGKLLLEKVGIIIPFYLQCSSIDVFVFFLVASRWFWYCFISSPMFLGKGCV